MQDILSEQSLYFDIESDTQCYIGISKYYTVFQYIDIVITDLVLN